jgi:hypothetical protein
MYNEKALKRIEIIQKKILFIQNIVEDVITERLPIILTHTKEILKQS